MTSPSWDEGTLRLALRVRETHGVQPGRNGPVCMACVDNWPCWPFHLSQYAIRAMFAQQAPTRADASTGYLWTLAGGRNVQV